MSPKRKFFDHRKKGWRRALGSTTRRANYWNEPGTIAVIRYNRIDAWKLDVDDKLTPLKCWWNTRQCRVLVTLPCGCQVLKNGKQPAACGACLRRLFRPYMSGAAAGVSYKETEQ